MTNGGFEESMNIDIGKPFLLLRGHFLDHISNVQKEFNAPSSVTHTQLEAFQNNLQFSTPKLRKVLNQNLYRHGNSDMPDPIQACD